jgi:signal transduction histidine kinase
MATSTIKTIEVVVLELTPTEAMWLKQAIQNPLYDTKPENEDHLSRTVRESLFNALKKCV